MSTEIAPALTPQVKANNPVGLTALIVAAVAFVFAIIPVLSFIAWLPALAAVILGIVGLVLKGRKRGLALAGLIVGVVAWIIAIIVSIAGVAGVVNAIDEQNNSTVAPAPGAVEQPAEAEQAEQTGQVGDRSNPAALGTAIESAEWTVVVNSYTPDAGTIVADANQFNSAAPEGTTYRLVNYTVTYKGENSSYAAEVQVEFVTDTGEVLNGLSDFVSLNDSFGLDELYAGGSVTGSKAIAVPNGSEVLIRVTPGILADAKFVQP